MRIFIGVILPVALMAITGFLAMRHFSGPTAPQPPGMAAVMDLATPDRNDPPKAEKTFVTPAGQAETAALANEAAQIAAAFNMYVGTMGEQLPQTPQDLVRGGFIGGIPNPPDSGRGAHFFFVRGHKSGTLALATRIFSKDTYNAINQSALATVNPIIREAGPFAPEHVDITPAISGTSFSCAHFALAGPTPEYYYLRRLH